MSLLSLAFAAITLLSQGDCPYIYESASPACSDDTPFNGYWWQGGWWVPGYITAETWYNRTPEYSYGRAVYYAPGVMEATAQVRKMSLDGYLDGVALIPCSEIGETVWLKRPGFEWEGPYLVVDCARRGDAWPIYAFRHEVVEVGWETKTRWGGEWPRDDVEVVKYDPNKYPVYGDPIEEWSWWIAHAKFEDWSYHEPNPIHVTRYGPRTWIFGRGEGSKMVTYSEVVAPSWWYADAWLQNPPSWY